MSQQCRRQARGTPLTAGRHLAVAGTRRKATREGGPKWGGRCCGSCSSRDKEQIRDACKCGELCVGGGDSRRSRASSVAACLRNTVKEKGTAAICNEHAPGMRLTQL